MEPEAQMELFKGTLEHPDAVVLIDENGNVLISWSKENWWDAEEDLA